MMQINMGGFMTINLYYKLSTCSRRAIRRKNGPGGRPYYYRPRMPLLKRLAEETGMTVEQVQDALMEERKELLNLTYGAAL